MRWSPGPRPLLVTEGIDPNSDADTLAEFDQFAARQNGLIPEAYRTLSSKTGDLGSKDKSTADYTQEKMTFAKDFVEVCRQLTEQMGQDLTLGKHRMKPVPPPKQRPFNKFRATPRRAANPLKRRRCWIFAGSCARSTT